MPTSGSGGGITKSQLFQDNARTTGATTLLRATVEDDAPAAAEAKTTTAATAELKPEFAVALEASLEKLQSSLPTEYQDKMMPLLSHFMTEYFGASQAAFEGGKTEECSPDKVAKRISTAIQYGLTYGMGPTKYTFDVVHEALRGDDDSGDIDFYEFGCDFFRSVMNLHDSLIMGADMVQQMQEQLDAGENVILLANHQSEADPQCVSAGLELLGVGDMAVNMIYVAGHKVTTDPLAVPFSMGRNLLCIHSKKHIDADPETKPIKQKQNLKAMNGLLNKLKTGGQILWVAPSGGRDRRDMATGKVPPAPFDSKTIDIFRLMGNKSKVPTHYYTLAMLTYDLCPPPDYVVPGVGEPRNVRFVPIGLYFGKELESVGGLEQRQHFNQFAMEQCEADYNTLVEKMHG
jgi:glycerol-3-phosphate O-acyltransferase